MAELPKFTPIGHGIWFWKPWRNLETLEAQKLWLALYTGADAKRSVPGLVPASIHSMSHTTGMTPNACWNAIDHLVGRGLVQFDEENLLVRLSQLPDALDRAHNDKAIWGWWSRFRTLPEVPLRDAHVPLLWSLVKAGKFTDPMVETWKKTFGTIVVPDHPLHLQRPSAYDTGTSVQPSLWGSPHSNKINHSGPPGDVQGTSGGGQRSGTGSGSGSGSGLPEQGGGPGEGRRLQLVPEPPPEPVDPRIAERERYAQEMHEARAAAAQELGGQVPEWLGQQDKPA